ncbi:MAG: LysM peptidoglycan-binding domain-containing protein [Campylobacterota bacterium]|nr:LysM peptidoglycan-binding domain-containing protein [Campylobacterota bacterium]
MIKTLLGLFLSFTFSWALLYENSFNPLDQKVLEELDIDNNFLKDQKLQRIYDKMLNHSQKYYIERFTQASVLIPQIKSVLKQNNVPDVFLFMAMAESGFKAKTRSWVGAKGIWQFMPSTGRIYGLTSDRHVDERLDVIKSTQAATQYLKRLHGMFGKWYLAAFAYNCGEGRVIEAIVRSTLDIYVAQNPKEAKSRKVLKYRKIVSNYTKKRSGFSPVYRAYNELKSWGITPTLEQLLHEQKNLRRQYLPKESRRYLRKIIALAMMGNRDYLFSKKADYIFNLGINSPLVEVEVKRNSSLKDIAQVIDVDYDKLRLFNAHIKNDFIPALHEECKLYVPYNKLVAYNENIDKFKLAIYKHPIPKYYRVKSGDTLSHIARKYKLSLKQLKRQNRLKSDRLRINQKLVIRHEPFKSSKKRAKGKIVHVVRSGDTLSAISKKYGIPYGKIKKRNNLRSNALKLNQRLIIPNKV